MRKNINCKHCNKELGWYDHKERIINVYDKDSEIKYVGRDIFAVIRCCDSVQRIKLD